MALIGSNFDRSIAKTFCSSPLGWVELLRNPSARSASLWPFSEIPGVIRDIACPILGIDAELHHAMERRIRPSLTRATSRCLTGLMGIAEFIIGPAEGRIRWLHPPYGLTGQPLSPRQITRRICFKFGLSTGKSVSTRDFACLAPIAKIFLFYRTPNQGYDPPSRPA